MVYGLISFLPSLLVNKHDLFGGMTFSTLRSDLASIISILVVGGCFLLIASC